jgi:hypothetical protein
MASATSSKTASWLRTGLYAAALGLAGFMSYKLYKAYFAGNVTTTAASVDRHMYMGIDSSTQSLKVLVINRQVCILISCCY